MNGTSNVYVGAARAGSGAGGIYRMASGAGAWERLANGLPQDTQVQAITVHPSDRDVVYIGTHRGPYRSRDRGDHWERLDFPDDGTQVWALTIHPQDPRILYAGTSPVGVYPATTLATAGAACRSQRCRIASRWSFPVASCVWPSTPPTRARFTPRSK